MNGHASPEPLAMSSHGKRKSSGIDLDESPSQAANHRTKRNRYIAIACNECKRRKIKCNGQTPCQRCGNLSLECLYAPNCCNNFKDTEEFKRMDDHINSLQEQVDTLFKNLNSLRSHVDTTSAASIESESYSGRPYASSVSLSQGNVLSPPSATRRSQSHNKHPRFHGPTSSAFNLGVAKSSLETMGITASSDALLDGELATGDASPNASPPSPPSAPSFPLQQVGSQAHPTKDPIWTTSREEAVRLCHVFHDEIGMMYPIFDMNHMLRHTTLLYTFMEAAHTSGLMQMSLPGADGIHDDETTFLKLILATALTLEGSGKSEAGERMFENVRPLIDRLFCSPVDVKGIKMLTAAGMYYFMRDDESTAWRIIGMAGRMCMELGLHHRETYGSLFDNEEECAAAVRVFWSVYCLDRRWSFGTGLPFVLQDTDIDPLLPRPDESVPYLIAMVAYGHIASRVWKYVSNTDSNAPISREDIGYLDYQSLQWLRSIPDSLKYQHPNSQDPSSAAVLNDPTESRGVRRLRVILYLRANLMRIQIYRPVLHTATSIMENMSYANAVVDVAKDTINVLTHVNQTSDIYRTQQVMFNYFLSSALAVLFLAVSHAPAQFSECCRDEFYMAIELVRGMSAHSFVSKRLWKTIKGLKEVAPKLGLALRDLDEQGQQLPPHLQQQNSRQQPQQQLHEGGTDGIVRRLEEDPHSSAAVAMAGLAGHRVDEAFLYGHHHVHQGGGAQQSLGQHHNDMHQQHTERRNHSQHPTSTAATAAATALRSPTNNSPNGMANDLTSLFEAVGGYAGLQQSLSSHNNGGATNGGGANNGFVLGGSSGGGGGNGTSNGESSGNGGNGNGMEGGGGAVHQGLWGTEDELARIMKDLF